MPNIQQNYHNPYQYQQQFGAYNVPSKGLEDIKKQENVAGKVADNFDPTVNFSTKVKNFVLSLLASAGVVRLTNWSLQPKNITDDMKVIDTFTNSRMYKVGQKLDNFGPFAWLSKKCGAIKAKLSNIPLPEFIKDFGRQYKIGSVSTWDKQGMYTLGKSSEAMQEFMTFLSDVSKKSIDTLKISQNERNLIYNLAQKVKSGKINHIDAFEKVEPIIKKLSAKALKEISPEVGKISNFLGITKDLNLSFAKTQALTGKTASGIVGKVFNNSATITGEASGGAVLGGKMALVMNAIGLITAFNAASEAEKGDKIKAFMEDYLAYTIGGYVMGMVVGKIFNHALGYAEFGMNLAKGKALGKQLGLENVKRVQDVVIGFNKEFDKNVDLQKLLKKAQKNKIVAEEGGIPGFILRKIKGQLTMDEAVKKMEGLGIKVPKNTTNSGLISILNKNVKSNAEMNALRKEIQGTMKSNIKFGSIFKSTDGTKLIDRLGKWLVQKPVAAIAKFMSFGKYTMHKAGGNFIGNFGRGFKRIGGGIGRMIFVGIVLVSPFHKMFAKLSHAIFGKPKKSLIDEDKQNDPSFGQNPVQNQPQPIQNPIQNPTQTQNVPSINLVDLYAKNMPKKQPPAPEYKPMNADNVDVASYVPNQMLTQESYVDPNVTQDLLTRRDLALMHADSAERNARELLSRI